MVAQQPTNEHMQTNGRESKHPCPPTLAPLEEVRVLVGQRLGVEQTLHAVLDVLMAAVGGELGQVLLADKDTGELVVKARRGGMDSMNRASETSWGRDLADAVVEAGHALVSQDIAAEPRVHGLLHAKNQLHGYVGIPLNSTQGILGVVNVLSSGPVRLVADVEAGLSALGALVGLAVENETLREELASSQLRLRERVKEISALYDVTREALTVPSFDAFLTYVARRLPASMCHQQASAVIRCTVGEGEHLAWSDDLDREVAEKLAVVPGAGPQGEKIAAGAAVIEQELGTEQPHGIGHRVGSVMAVPIAVNERIVGTVAVFYPNSRWSFMEEEKRLLCGISEQIAQFSARDAVGRQSQQRTQEISSLFEVSKALASVVELKDLLPVIEDTLVETLRPAEAGALLLFDEGTGMLTVESAFGYDSDPLRKLSLRVGESISGKVFEAGVPGVWATPEEAASGMASMSEHNRDLFRQASGGLDHPNSAIGVPLVYREGKIGVVTLETLRSKNGLSVSDLPFLQALAELIVVNVDKMWLLQQTEQTKAAEEANRLKSELIAALAHDMRTPLASIKGYASALLLDDVEWDDEARVEHLRIIDEEANELQTMIQDLLESSIIDAGLLQIEKEPILMPRLVEQMVDEMTRRTARHQFVTSFGKDFPIVDADPRRITQVIRNLLDNAVKYSPDGGLVVVRGQVTGDEVIVSVADEGIGLAPEHLNRLFEKFFRLKSPLGQQVRGSGLGLPVSRTIVESHGGRIWAESELGKGTTIYFSLPRNGGAVPSDED